MKTNQKGITIVELVVYIGILGVFTIASLGSLNDFMRSRRVASGLDRLQDNAQVVFSRMTKEIHWSSNYLVYDLENLDSLRLCSGSCGGPTDTVFSASNNRILLGGKQLTAQDVIVTKFDVTEYELAGNVQCLKVSLGLKYDTDAASDLELEDELTVSLRKKAI